MSAAVQRPLRPHSRYRKLRRISAPQGVWTTSGWNWTPKSLRARFSMVATGVLAVLAVIVKPGRRRLDQVAVAHPADEIAVKAGKETGVIERLRVQCVPNSFSWPGVTLPPSW